MLCNSHAHTYVVTIIMRPTGELSGISGKCQKNYQN